MKRDNYLYIFLNVSYFGRHKMVLLFGEIIVIIPFYSYFYTGCMLKLC